MKKFCITFFVLLIIIATVVYLGGESEQEQSCEYLRIHVRANSNSNVDQDIKYTVKDEVVKFITPYVADCVDKGSAIEIMESLLEQIENVADATLLKHGFKYSSNAEIRRENFPTRVYDGVTLESGDYDALILELGSGTGDNWWCVIYPPLCFTAASTDIEYRSIIYEIINNFFK